MIELAIVLVGMIGSALIMLIGFVWRWRHQLIATTAIIVTAAVGVLLWPQGTRNGEEEQPAFAHMEILSWGERDSMHLDEHTGDIGPGHIVYAVVSITAGESEISIPDINTVSPQSTVWLALTNTGRDTLGGQTLPVHSGTALIWLPSHEDKLVSEFGGEPFPIPDASCSNVQPQHSCQVTLVWYLKEHGSVSQIHGLTLHTPSEPDAAGHTSANDMFVPWPDMEPDSHCRGQMAAFCGDSATSTGG